MSIQPMVDHYPTPRWGTLCSGWGAKKARNLDGGECCWRYSSLDSVISSTQAVIEHLNDWAGLAAVDAILAAPDIETLLTVEPPG